MNNNRLVSVFFFALLLQFLFVYLFGDVFLFVDDIIFILIIPFFINGIIKKEKIVVISLVYIILKSLLLLVWERNFLNYGIDLILILKPIIIFWGFYFLFEYRTDIFILKTEKILRFVFVSTAIYGVIQFVMYLKFRISIPMQDTKFFHGADAIAKDPFSLVRASSIFAHPLWYGYVCAFCGTFYLFKRKYWISIIALLGVLVTFSRWALAIYLLGVFGYFLIEHKKLTKRVLLVFIPLTLVFIITQIDQILYIYNKLWSGYNDHAIKIYGIIKGIDLISLNPFGYGIGSYGTSTSGTSKTYNLVNFNSHFLNLLPWVKSGIESFATIISVQLGVDSLIFYFSPFCSKLKLNKEGVFFGLLLIFPIISLYNPYVLILSAFSIQYFKRDLLKPKI